MLLVVSAYDGKEGTTWHDVEVILGRRRDHVQTRED